MPCVAHLGEVARALPRLSAAGIGVLVVVQAKSDVLRLHLAKHPLPFPVASDPDRAAYRAFGLGCVGWSHFARPGVLLGYLKLMLRGQRPRAPAGGEDVRQLGGDFVLSRDRIVEFAYPSRVATDRPTVDAVLAAVAR